MFLIVSLDNLSQPLIDKIQVQRENANSNNLINSQSLVKEDSIIEEEKFCQFLLIRMNTNSKEDVLKYIKILEKREDVLIASPNFLYKKTETPNDAYINSQWAVSKINLPDAWNITTGSENVNVGIIDSGIEGTHPDLSHRINVSLSKDFTGGNAPLVDIDGHGTKVAGIIGAQGNNSIGVAGTCWNINLVSLKAYNTDDITTSGIISAVQYADSQNIPILNFSLTANSSDLALLIAVGGYDGLFVCSAGNEGIDITDASIYPPCYDLNNMICVANTTSNDILASDSNYSSSLVDLAAPGSGIYTTTIGGTYVTTSGTSFSAPYVVGVAALLKSKYASMSTDALKYYILNGCDSIDQLEGRVINNNRLNAYNALNGVKSYTVKFNANGGIGTMSDVSVPFNYYACLPSNGFEKESLPFAGWHAKRTSDNKWYYTNGSDSGWYLEGQQPSGYEKFLYEDESDICMDMSTNGDTVTMYAQWIDIEYTIVFNGNSGTGSMSNQTVQYGVPENLNTATFTKENFEFYYWYAKNSDGEVYCTTGTEFGWYLNDDRPYPYGRKLFADGAAVHEIEGLSDGDVITFYAYWEPTFGELGDADMDGEVTARDATLIQKYDTGLATLTPTQILLADVNYDGEANVRDATMIRKYLAGLLDDFG